MKTRHTHTWLPLAVVLAGCSELKGPEADARPSRSDLRQDAPLADTSAGDTPADSTFETPNMAGRNWFTISIEVDSTVLKPNQQIELDVTWTAVFATPDAELSIMLPEVEAAELSGWNDDFKLPVGMRLPVKLDSSTGFGTGDEVKRTVKVTIPAAGIYRVVASATSALTQTEEVALAQPTVLETIWLWIDEEGGRVLHEFDPAVIPDGFQTQPGPFRELITGTPKGPAKAAGDAGVAYSDTCSSLRVCVELVYHDEELNAFVPVPAPSFTYEALKVGTREFLGRATGRAAEDGSMIRRCVADRWRIFRIVLDHPMMAITPRPEAGVFSIPPSFCGKTLQIDLDAVKSRVWVNAWHTIKKSRGVFGVRSKVDIRLIAVRPSAKARCSFRGRTITLEYNRSRNCIWRGYGVFVFAHEYGHAVQEEIGGGLASIGRGCREHAPGDGVETLQCAYNEGFADYHGYRTKPISVFPEQVIHSDWRFTDYYMEPNRSHKAGMDGSLNEGPVMSFFYDLFDSGTAEPHDSLALRERDVLAVMRDCRIGGKRPDGIDLLAWCLEGRVDGTVTRGDEYFTARRCCPRGHVRPSGHPWSWTHVRRLWLMNLYGVAEFTPPEPRPWPGR